MKHFNIIVRSSSSESLAIKLHKHIIETGVTIRTIPMRHYFVASHKMILKELSTKASLAKLISLESNISEMRVRNSTQTLRTMFANGCNSLLLTSDTTQTHLGKPVGTDKNKLLLSESSLRAFVMLSAKCRNTLCLVELSIQDSVLKRFVSIKAPSIMGTTMLGYGQAQKYESVDNVIGLEQKISPTSIKPAGGDADIMYLSSKVSRAYLTRYRTLAEMDSNGTTNYTLQEFDNITLEDLDYVVV